MINIVIEVDDSTWQRWQKIAEAEQTTLEEIMVRLMYEYEMQQRKPGAETPPPPTPDKNRYTDWSAYF